MTATWSHDREAALRHAQRLGGQVNALGHMIADDRPFPEVTQQLFAARGSLDSLLVRLVDLELDGQLSHEDVRTQVDRLLRVALGCKRSPGNGRRTLPITERTTTVVQGRNRRNDR